MPKMVQTAAATIQNGQTMNLAAYVRLRPTLVGGWAKLRRYTVAAEKQVLGAYNAGADTTYAWPSLGVGEVPDLTYTQVYLESALAQYFSKAIGVNGTAIPTAPNKVRAANVVFQTANGSSRNSAFGDRDVQVGDAVQLSAVVASTLVTYSSVVTGFVPEAGSTSVGSATAASTNASSQSSSGPTATQVAGTPKNYITATASGTYNSIADGAINRTYTVTVIQSSAGGVLTTALLKVVSSDGGDNVASFAPAAAGTPFNIGTKGVQLTITINTGNPVDSGVSTSDLIAGQSWTIPVGQAYTAPTVASGGTYTGLTTLTYVVTCTTGGTLAGGTAQITCVSSDGTDKSGPTTVTGAGVATAVGSFGATITFSGAGASLRKGDVWSFTATAASPGAVKTLLLRDNVTASLLGVDCNITLLKSLTGVQLPATRTSPSAAYNWTQDPVLGVTLKAGVYVNPDATFTASGVPQYFPLVSGTAFAHYRAWAPGTGAPVRVNSLSAALAAFGSVDPDNPLGHAAALALANTAGGLLSSPSGAAAANTDVVVCLPLTGAPTSGTAVWQSALNTLAGESDTYNLVPLSSDPAVHALFAAHVAAQSASTAGGFRRCILHASVASPAQVLPLTAGALTCTVTSGTNGNNLVTGTAPAGFVTSGVRPGDTLRINYATDTFGNTTYASYTVSSVVSDSVLYLTAGPASPIPVAVQAQVWRTPTTDELVAQVTAKAASYASDRVIYLWPDSFVTAGTTIPAGRLGAAVAGLMGSVPSQQGLRGVGLQGVDSTPRSFGTFTNTQLDAMAAGGVFVVATDAAGNTYVRNPNTTNPISVSHREEMVTRNADCVRFAIDDAFASVRGVGNLTDAVKDMLQAKLDQTAAKLKGGNASRGLGPPATALTLVAVSPTAGQPDAVDVSVNMTGPYPLNATNLTLTLS